MQLSNARGCGQPTLSIALDPGSAAAQFIFDVANWVADAPVGLRFELELSCLICSWSMVSTRRIGSGAGSHSQLLSPLPARPEAITKPIVKTAAPMKATQHVRRSRAPSTKALRPTPHLPPKGGIWDCELKTLTKNVDSVLTHPIWGKNLNLIKILRIPTRIPERERSSV